VSGDRVLTSIVGSPAPSGGGEGRAGERQPAPFPPKEGRVRMRLDEPDMEAALKAVSLSAAAIPPSSTAKQKGCEAFLVRLLQSRMRLVRSEFLRMKLEDMDDDERLQYRVKERRVAYQRLYFWPWEVMLLKEGLEELGRRAGRDLTAVDSSLLLRCTVLGQAMQEGRSPHSELVTTLNRHRGARLATAKTRDREGGRRKTVAETANLRIRMREWTLRAVFFAVIAYLRYNVASPQSWNRAYRLLERVVRLHRDAIASQVRYGRPGFYLMEGMTVRRGLGIEPRRQAYVTPRVSIGELRIIREGLELRRGEMARAGEAARAVWRSQLNPTERTLLLKTTLLYAGRSGGGQRGGRRVGAAIRKLRERTQTGL